MRVWRKSWLVIGVALALVAIAGLTPACSRKTIPPPAPATTNSSPAHDAQDLNGLALIWMETTPPGAAIVRVSNGRVLGYSPEIIEFLRSDKPEFVRFELKGYLPLTREVSAASDSELKVELQAIPQEPAVPTKKSKGGKGHKDAEQKSGG